MANDSKKSALSLKVKLVPGSWLSYLSANVRKSLTCVQKSKLARQLLTPCITLTPMSLNMRKTQNTFYKEITFHTENTSGCSLLALQP